MANLPDGVSATGLASDSSTLFTTVAGGDSVAWSLYAVSKTAVNTTPATILTGALGSGTPSLLAANDNLVFIETGVSTPGGSTSTVISCDPADCTASQQNWYTSHGTVSVCDPSSQECFIGSSYGSYAAFQFAKQGTPSQASPQDFDPILDMASGAEAAANGYLYVAGSYGVNSNPTYAVVQRISEAGTGVISTLANFGADYGLDAPLIVSGTRVYVIAGTLDTNITGIVSVPLPNGVGSSIPSFLAGTTMPTNAWLTAWGDETAVYFGSAARQWVTCPASGCTASPAVLADASAAAPYLTGDAQAIYWVNTRTDPTTGSTSGGSLMRLAR